MKPAAFTLLEMLIVMGIMLVVLAFSVPVITGLSKSNNLNSGARLVANLLTIARSEAINRRALIRFEVATTWPTSDYASAYRKMTLFQHDVATATDTQITKWETLPVGISFQPTDPTVGNANPPAGGYFFALKQTSNLSVGGQPVTTAYIEFLPTGALNIDAGQSPVRMRVVPGFLPSAAAITPTLTSTSNWMDASIDSLVGRIALSRP